MNTECCLTCGYDLRGSPTDTCPECGAVLDYNALCNQIMKMRNPLIGSLGASIVAAALYVVGGLLLRNSWFIWPWLLLCYGLSLVYVVRATVKEIRQSALRKAIMTGVPAGEHFRWPLGAVLFLGQAGLSAVLLAIVTMALDPGPAAFEPPF